MRECLNSSCDVACWTTNEKNDVKLPGLYDWTYFKQFKDPDFWFLHNLLPAEKNRAESAIKNGITVIDKRKKFLDHLSNGDWFPFKYESKKSSYIRINNARKKITEIIKKEGLKDNELLIISHQGALKYFTALGFNSSYKMIDSVDFENAEICKHDLNMSDPELPIYTDEQIKNF